jgi:hypothetical protein
MVTQKYHFLSGNVTVLGHFNPAILRPDFIEREFPEWRLGTGKLVSPENVPLVADLQYAQVRLFMDPERMIVQDAPFTKASDMMAPRIVRDYLQKLPYTPVQVIGFNFHAEAAPEDMITTWENIAELRSVQERMASLGFRLVNVRLRYAFPAANPVLAEAIVVGQDGSGVQVQLVLNVPGEGEKTRLDFNVEFQDVVTRPDRIAFLVAHSQEMGQLFFTVLDALSVRSS